MKTRALGHLIAFSLAVATAGCGDEAPFSNDNGDLYSLNQDLLFSSLPPDAIPALTLPDMVAADEVGAEYLFDFDRVLGVVVEGEARAYPHNILWHHEILNDRIGDTWISATFCPLTGSGVVFDPFVDGTRLDLGVSGLLFANNLIMYDRISGAVYGPQLSVEGKCATFRDTSVGVRAVHEMSWGRWKELYPDTKVVAGDTGFPRNYRSYPYGSYDQITSSDLLFPMSAVDTSRPIKERVLAIRIGDGGRGYPFGELRESGEAAALNALVGRVPTAVFCESRDGETALAFDARLGGQTLSFTVSEGGTWTDAETGSTLTIDGSSIGGPMEGERLTTRSSSSGSHGDTSSPPGTRSSSEARHPGPLRRGSSARRGGDLLAAGGPLASRQGELLDEGLVLSSLDHGAVPGER